MSEDIGERLIRRIENSDTVAMHEIERTLRQLRAELAAARRCLGFFASVIKSGEDWTETCEKEYRAALKGGNDEG